MAGDSAFSAGLSGDCDRNRWETSSNPLENRFSARRFSSRGVSAISFRCRSKLLKPSAVAQKLVQISGSSRGIQSGSLNPPANADRLHSGNNTARTPADFIIKIGENNYKLGKKYSIPLYIVVLGAKAGRERNPRSEFFTRPFQDALCIQALQFIRIFIASIHIW